MVLQKIKHTFLNRIIFLSLILFVMVQVFLWVHNQGYLTIPPRIIATLKALVFIGSVFLIAGIFVRLTIDKVFPQLKRHLTVEQKIFFTNLYSWGIYALATAVVFYQLGVSMSNITLFLGFTATGFAFALRDIIFSVFVWFAVLTKRPFTIGDFVRIGEYEGTVETIGTFFISLDKALGTSKDIIQIPNKILLDKPIMNYGKDDIIENLRFTLKGLPADTDKFIGAISQGVHAIIKNKKNCSVQLDTLPPFIVLSINYGIPYKERGAIKTKITAAVFLQIKDFAAAPAVVAQ